MDPAEMRPLLRAVRRLRAGSLDLQGVPPSVSALLRGNLAGTCRALAVWADAEVGDPRAADALVRTYGLGRMPETRAAIGRSLRSTSGRRGISPAAVDDLLRATEAQLARQADRLVFPGPWGRPTPPVWVDPFPGASSRPAERRELQQVLCTAWADVPDEPLHDCSAALLLYEEEHGLRLGTRAAIHREQRRRLRRLAWSMLTVARERHVGRQPDDVLVDLLLGPRRMAIVELLPPEAVAALVGVAGPHAPDVVETALDHVRGAVRQGRPEALELLALLREAMARGAHPARPAATMAGIAVLTTIVDREHRRPAGALAASLAVTLASEAGDLLARLPAGRSEQRSRLTRTLHDGLRAAQEAAELHDALGDSAAARRSLASMSRLLRLLDPEDQEEVREWQQQHHQTRSTVARHASLEGDGARWLRLAEGHASRSLDLAEALAMSAGFRLVPASQLVAAALVALRQAGGTEGGPRPALVATARAHLARAEAAAHAAAGFTDRPTSSARLSVARRWWELALLCGDADEVIAARRAAHERVVPSTLPHDLDKLARLEAASRARGLPALDVVPVGSPVGS